VLAALLRVAEVLGAAAPSALRLEGFTLDRKRVTLHLAGPKAKATAIACGASRRQWRAALHTGLAFKIAPPTTADLEHLAAACPTAATPIFETLQTCLSSATLNWERELARCAHDDPNAPAAALTATLRLHQLLAAFRPHLKRRSTDRLRAGLAQVRKTLHKAATVQSGLDDITTYQASQRPDAADQLSGLRDAAASASQLVRQMLSNRLDDPAWRQLSAALRSFIIDPPARSANVPATVEAAPGLLESAAGHLARRQLAFSTSDPASRRRTAQGVVRLQTLLQVLSPVVRSRAGAAELLDDLGRLGELLEILGQLESVEKAVAVYLDAWAERQGRRKAPQMHGVEQVLEYRQARRAERARQLRALNEAWKPLRVRKLRRRIAALLEMATPFEPPAAAPSG
jgi:hypothetical protein